MVQAPDPALGTNPAAVMAAAHSLCTSASQAAGQVQVVRVVTVETVPTMLPVIVVVHAVTRASPSLASLKPVLSETVTLVAVAHDPDPCAEFCAVWSASSVCVVPLMVIPLAAVMLVGVGKPVAV